MIPKIIHYCWFGRKGKPKQLQEYIDGWHKVMPDYEIKEWNESNYDYKVLPFTREAYSLGKFAFVSDVVRLQVLYREGGIYLDTDVKVLKSFDSFLSNKSFLSYEEKPKVSTAVIGAEPGLNWIKDFLEERYLHRHFITRKGLLLTLANTDLLTYYIHWNKEQINKELKIFDVDYFSAKLFPSKEYVITDRTVAVHEFTGTWLTKPLTFSDKLHNALVRYLHL